MTSHSETGHVKNVANFEIIISYCVGYGEKYNPAKEALKIESLNSLYEKSRTAIADVTTTKNNYDLAIDQRQSEFEPLKSTATRIMNALQASDAPQKTIEDAKNINNKIQGRRVGKINEEDEEKRTISVSQQSFDSLLDNFSKLVDLISSEPAYNPNEEALKVETLNNYIQQLSQADTNVINAHTAYSNAMIARNETLYATDTGLVDTALNVKKYVKSVFGATSPQYKQISKIEFKKLK